MPQTLPEGLWQAEPQEHGGNSRTTTPRTLPAAPQHAESQEWGSNGAIATLRALPTALLHTEPWERGGNGRLATLQGLPAALQHTKPQPTGARMPEKNKKLAPARTHFISACQHRFTSKGGRAELKATHIGPARGQEGSSQQPGEGCRGDQGPMRNEGWQSPNEELPLSSGAEQSGYLPRREKWKSGHGEWSQGSSGSVGQDERDDW